MDELPVSFGPQPERSTDGTFEKADLDRAMKILLEIVWHHGGFRYRKRYTNAKYLRYSFYCAQDIDKFGHEISTEITRDRSQMERFARGGKLSLLPSFRDRKLSLSLCHKYHVPYEDIHLSDEIRDIIESECLTKSPSQIYQIVQEMKVTGYEVAVQPQIYYLWQKANTRHWKRNDKQFESSKLLFEKKSEEFFHLEFSVANYRGLAFYINASISTLALRTKELAIDATYGTNSAGSDLFAVLAEFDGTGVPSAYLFIEKSVENSRPGVPGKMVQILDQFMRTLLHLASPSSIQLAIIDLRKVCPNKLPGSFQYWMILIGIKGGIQVRLLGQEITKILLQCFTNI
ncbi:hypothetical protein K3495_g14167 [Podosphaera aphanis]|nr:hypothetical protein K3495_g14167 [Podosphaera aphanis]